MNRIYIDGIKTRQNIADETHRAFGVKQLCEELGVPTGLVTKYIRQGYGDGQIIIDLIRKGIPFELLKEPVPCRVKKVHQRRPKNAPKNEQNGLGILNETEGESEEKEAMIFGKEATLFIAKTQALEWKNAEVQILESVKNACKSIIEQIEIIETNQIYKSLFGGEEK